MTVAISPARCGGGRAWFGAACGVCPLRDACTSSLRGRVVTIHPMRPPWPAPATRSDVASRLRGDPARVERKLAYLLRRRHGGRRARVRGLVRVPQDWKLLTGVVKLARFAALGLRSTSTGWQVQPADAACATLDAVAQHAESL